MKKRKDWIIIDIRSKKALHGINQRTFMFSSEEIAVEVAEQLFNDLSDCLIVNVAQLLGLTICK